MRKVRTIDCQYVAPELAAAFLVHHQGEAYFVETNTAHAVPYLLEALKEEGLKPSQVRWIFITHVHLDHSAGTSALLKACPQAQVVAHPRAAKHLIDPAKLIASAKQVYGEEIFSKLYGEILPIPQEKVKVLEEGEKVPFAGTDLSTFYTRGHANHHFCLFDPVLEGVFTGDSFGLAYPLLQRSGLFIFPSSSPTDFDPRAAKESVDRILETGAKRVFLTHFGELTELAEARRQLYEHLNLSEKLFERALQGSQTYDELRSQFESELRAFFKNAADRRGLILNEKDWETVDMDLRLNADGIAFAGIRARPAKI